MKVSVCVTVLNEEGTIKRLVNSLLNQTKKADEIVVIDGGSSDNTFKILKNLASKHRRLNVHKIRSSRSKARNIAVKMAIYDVIAMTDAGCIARPDWLENLTKPFINNNVQVVAGFYDMVGRVIGAAPFKNNNLHKAMTVFLGIMPQDFNNDFLPSTRSIAFRKNVWESVGEFPEELDDTAEDTIFNYNLLKNGVKITRVKNARVEWVMPQTLGEFSKKIYTYAKGDAKSGNIIFPTKGLLSHNIKSLFKIVRYILAFYIFIIGISNPFYWYFLTLGVFIYLFWSFNKVHKYYGYIGAGLWGVALQIITDLAGIAGFISGILNHKYTNRRNH